MLVKLMVADITYPPCFIVSIGRMCINSENVGSYLSLSIGLETYTLEAFNVFEAKGPHYSTVTRNAQSKWIWQKDTKAQDEEISMPTVKKRLLDSSLLLYRRCQEQKEILSQREPGGSHAADGGGLSVKGKRTYSQMQ